MDLSASQGMGVGMGEGMGMGWTGRAHLSQQLCPLNFLIFQFNAGTGAMPLHHTPH